MRHPIQDRTAQSTFHLLVGHLPCPQLVANNLLEAKHRRFGQRASMIAALLFPAFVSLFSDGAQKLLPRPPQHRSRSGPIRTRINLTTRYHLACRPAIHKFFNAKIFRQIKQTVFRRAGNLQAPCCPADSHRDAKTKARGRILDYTS